MMGAALPWLSVSGVWGGVDPMALSFVQRPSSRRPSNRRGTGERPQADTLVVQSNATDHRYAEPPPDSHDE